MYLKIRKYILFIALLLVLPLSIAFSGDTASGRAHDAFLNAPKRLTVLCAGVDEAAENTDVLMLATISPEKKEITVLQIPRDTYFRLGKEEGKINRLYPAYRLSGRDQNSAMEQLAREISDAFGVTIDYYAVTDYSSISYLVDRLGGLSVNVPADFPCSDGTTVPAGVQSLNGKQTVAFIRHRAGYVEGDLARVDAQKLILAAAYKKLKNEVSLSDLVCLIPDLYKRIVTDMTVSRQISLACAYARGRGEYAVRFLTLPGAPTRANGDTGAWYYIANKKASDKVLARYFDAAVFDKDSRMTDSARAHIASIYENNDVTYTVYTEETIDKLEIKTKKDG